LFHMQTDRMRHAVGFMRRPQKSEFG